MFFTFGHIAVFSILGELKDFSSPKSASKEEGKKKSGEEGGRRSTNKQTII